MVGRYGPIEDQNGWDVGETGLTMLCLEVAGPEGQEGVTVGRRVDFAIGRLVDLVLPSHPRVRVKTSPDA